MIFSANEIEILKTLFIGPYSYGSTSLMRVNCIIAQMNLTQIKIIDIEVPFFQYSRVSRSLASRYKIGPLIGGLNNYILDQLQNDYVFDLVWVDKGVFIEPKLISKLREKSKLLIHYTPDPAFTFHRSRFFFKAVPFYDYCITTKSFEIEDYKKTGANRVIYCTQGYDKFLHRPYHTFQEKDKPVSFVGHYEKYRGEVVKNLIENGVEIHVAGFKWRQFCKKYRHNLNLHYHGEGVFGEEYARFISSSYLSLGLVSKWIPELHTTRTMEIPACGTLLITELNNETQALYNKDEAVFFEDLEELVQKLIPLLKDKAGIEEYIAKANRRLLISKFDYESIVQDILNKIGLI
jgi:spore maturation protein CgeB